MGCIINTKLHNSPYIPGDLNQLFLQTTDYIKTHSCVFLYVPNTESIKFILKSLKHDFPLTVSLIVLVFH